MEAIRQIVDSALLGKIVSLPKGFQNKKVELIIFLSEEKPRLPSLTVEDIDAMLENSITESLIGVLPDSNLSAEDYRAERLEKYERFN